MSAATSSSLPYRSTPPHSEWGHYDHRGHVVQFYSQDLFLLDELSRFIGTALGAGDAAVTVATQVHREGLEHRFRERGLNPAIAIKEGRYIPMDAAETLSKFMRDGYPDADLFRELMGPVIVRARAAAEGRQPRVVAFGEMVALLWGEGNIEAAIQLERLWNELAKTHSFSLRCAYPMAGFFREEHTEPFLRICGEHSDVIPADTYTSLGGDEERLRNIAHLQQKEQSHEALLLAKKRLENEITERMNVERKLRDSEKSLRELSGRLLRMQDEERRHLGRELHDSVGQYLAVLKMSLDSLERTAKEKAEDHRIADCIDLAEQCITEVRTMSYLLYPPMLEEMGLKTAIPWYLEGFAKRSGIETTLDISDSFGRLTREVEQAVFRLLQESLTNIHRHSGSATAHISLSMKDGLLRVEVRDKGRGMPAEILETRDSGFGTPGVGLRGMNERIRQLGGDLELFSSEVGTVVCATVPVESLPDEAN
jgi:signal transduction histidine kinase